MACSRNERRRALTRASAGGGAGAAGNGRCHRDRRASAALASTRPLKTNYSPECRAKRAAYTRAWRKANKERGAVTKQAWRDANKERSAITSRAWREANREHLLAIKRAWADANKEQRAAKLRAWKEENKERVAAQERAWRKENAAAKRALIARRRAARLVRTPAWADQEAIKAIYAEAARLSRETGVEHHVDHVIPLQGRTVSGLHVETNLQIIPAADNHKKANRFE